MATKRAVVKDVKTDAPAKKPGKVKVKLDAPEVPFHTGHRPRPDDFPAWAEKLIPKICYSITSKNGTYVIAGWSSKNPDSSMMWLRDKKKIEMPTFETAYVNVRADGHAALVGEYLGNEVFEWTPDGTRRSILKGENLWSASYTRDGYVACFDED